MTMPRVSVVVPTYNQADLLRIALQSVLDQTVADWEMVVINNFSDDHTVQVVESFCDPRIRRIDFANNGVIAASRNVGIREARGEWVAFLDSDDAWFSDKLERCLALAGPDTDAVAHREEIVQDGAVLGLTPPVSAARTTWRSLLLDGNCLSPSALLVRKSKLSEAGGFAEDPAIVTAEDYDLWLRLAQAGLRVVGIDTPLGLYRHHPSQNTRNIARHLAANLEVVRRHGLFLEGGMADRLRLRRMRALQHYSAMRNFAKAGQTGAALDQFRRAAFLFPAIPRLWAGVVLALLPGRAAANGLALAWIAVVIGVHGLSSAEYYRQKAGMVLGFVRLLP